MRAKLKSPDADGIFSGSNPDRLSVTSGIKKIAIATPWMNVGTSSVQKSADVLNCDRMNSTSAKIRKAPVAKSRGSTLCTVRPTGGVRIIARTPTGASTMPACVAV